MRNRPMENVDWSNEDTDWPSEFWRDLPVPMYWRVMVAPVAPKEVSEGGIVLALSNQEAQDILNFVGQVVAVGAAAGKHERLGGNGAAPAQGFPKVGDYVAYGRYSGQKMICHGVKVVVINDDEILATIPNPEAIKTSK